LPFKPRVERRRRGPDFFKMFEMALEPALRKEVDLVVHGGDILYRSKVPPKLVQMAFEPLQKTADGGIPVYIVPGNHERSAIPFRLLASHPNIHIFNRPKTFLIDVKGSTLALSGFPYVRDNIRLRFLSVLEETGWKQKTADASVLCMHQCVEGASLQMGNRVYVFRDHHDVIAAADLPTGAATILSGHIHRFQVLTRDLRGRPLAAPVCYPGSTERTSFVEKDEFKGYLILDIDPDGSNGGRGKLISWKFHPLPARPMYVLEMKDPNPTVLEYQSWLSGSLKKLPEDSVVKVRFCDNCSPQVLKAVNASWLRSIAPFSMNVNIEIRKENMKG